MRKVIVIIGCLLTAGFSFADSFEQVVKDVSQLEGASVKLSVRFEYSYRPDWVEHCKGYLINRNTIATRKDCVTSGFGGKSVYYSFLLSNSNQPFIGGDISRTMTVKRDVAYITVDERFTAGLPVLPVYHQGRTHALDNAFRRFLASHGIVEHVSRSRSRWSLRQDVPFIYNGRLVGIVRDSISGYGSELPYDKLVILDDELANML